jgi:hypothetical protein
MLAAPHYARMPTAFQPVEAVFAKMDTLVLERIAKIMSYIKTTAGVFTQISDKKFTMSGL